MKKIWWIIIIVIILILLVPVLLRKGKKKTVKEGMPEIPVVVTTVQKRNIEEWINYSVIVEGLDQTMVFSDLPGRFSRFVVREGSYVHKDNVIAYIEREVPGLEIKPIPVKAPLTGYVSLFPIDRGTPVMQNKPIAQIASIKMVKVKFSVPENTKLNPGDPLKLKINDLSETFIGKIKFVSRFPDPVKKTTEVIGTFKNKNMEIKPGMFGEVFVRIAQKKGCLSVPEIAIIGIENKYVFKVKDGRAEETPISVGISNGYSAEILGDIHIGDTIIVKGQHIVKDGSKVRVEEDK